MLYNIYIYIARLYTYMYIMGARSEKSRVHTHIQYMICVCTTPFLASSSLENTFMTCLHCLFTFFLKSFFVVVLFFSFSSEWVDDDTRYGPSCEQRGQIFPRGSSSMVDLRSRHTQAQRGQQIWWQAIPFQMLQDGVKLVSAVGPRNPGVHADAAQNNYQLRIRTREAPKE